ncbi:hypothetical protein MKW94_000844 [Papaver nudicaule]|uniref:ATP synthase subunit beta, mitochondrial n=1 Tax=Papaver nudicaule TaxID=74823 RepID=A0AA41S426_PAPNU|nr:hypothetical protein [Papaver nudicaule]
MVVRFLNYILLYISESKCALVYSQMNEPPGACARVGLTCLTVAEHFRDAEGQDVLLFIDYIFRFTQVTLFVACLDCLTFDLSYPNLLNYSNFVLCRLTLRCLLCLVVSHLLLVTNLLWLPILEVCKSVSLPPKRVPSHPCKLFMFLRSISIYD